MAKYVVFPDKAGEWRWRLVGDNGETVAQSEAYTRKADARRGAEDAVRTAVVAAGVEIEEE